MRPTTKRKPPTESNHNEQLPRHPLPSPSEVEKPTPIPVGTYLFTVDGQPRFDKSTKKQTEFVEFTCRILQPGPDVDATALSEYQAKFGSPTGKQMKLTFYEGQEWRLVNKDGTGFLDHLGVAAASPSVSAAISQAPGQQFWGTVTHRPSTNQQTGEVNVYAEISQTAKV
jgi:hypothetical protein